MQNTKVLSLTCFALVLVALVSNHALGRIEIIKPRLLPVETFPRTIGDWKAGKTLPVDPTVQQVLKTARLEQRNYTRSDGKVVDLLLLTAADYADFHDPTVCFPGHGWQLSNRRPISVDGQTINMMYATHKDDGKTQTVYYWLVGNYVAQVPHSLSLQKFNSIRRAITGEDGQSLFVRVIASGEKEGEQTASEFTRAIMPALRQLASAKPAN
jgi:EpsI family protein